LGSVICPPLGASRAIQSDAASGSARTATAGAARRVLGPLLEQVAEEYAGRVRLVKVDVDRNPGLSGQFGIQSIPTVVAFKDGMPFSDFLGAQPEPVVRTFFESLLPSRADGLAEEGRRAFEAGDVEGARARFEEALAERPDHRAAAVGLAEAMLQLGDLDRTRELAQRWPNDPDARRVLARANLQAVAAGADAAGLEARLGADEDDAEAHYRLGALLALDAQWEPALEHLLATVALDRRLDDDGGRLRMLEIFGLLGEGHALVDEYRRRLTNVLF
jgi:putative thioredoxin